MEESVFLKKLGNTPRMKIIQYFIEGRDFDYSATDLLDAKVSWRTLHKTLPALEHAGIIRKTRKIGRATLYQLNKDDHTAQQLTKLYDHLIREAITEQEKKTVTHPPRELPAR